MKKIIVVGSLVVDVAGYCPHFPITGDSPQSKRICKEERHGLLNWRAQKLLRKMIKSPSRRLPSVLSKINAKWRGITPAKRINQKSGRIGSII
jgi:hypothetical protein